MQINKLPNLQRDVYPDRIELGVNNKQKLSELSIADLVSLHDNYYLVGSEYGVIANMLSEEEIKKVKFILNEKIDNIDWDN